DEDRRFMQAMIDFRRMTFRQSEFDVDVYRRAYERHQSEVTRYFAGREHTLLDISDINLLPERGFELLANFLECDAPRKPFPRNDGHSRGPQLAFMEALARGEIVSQTGIVP